MFAFSRRPSTRFHRGRRSAKTGPAGTAPGPPPAVPTLTAPANFAVVVNGTAITLSATSTDGDLTRMDWILDPAGAATVVATDSVAPYSQSWTPTGVSIGQHTLVARAVRGIQSTDSTAITINVTSQAWTRVASANCLRAWQSDFGVAQGNTPLASGTTPQAVTLSGSPAGNVAFRMEIQVTGVPGGAATMRYGIENDGSTSTWIQQNVPIPAGGAYAAQGALAGVTINFPLAVTYTAGDVYQGTSNGWVEQKNTTSAAQATASKQPRILSIGAGTGRLALRGDGVDDSMLEPTLDLPSPSTTPTFVYGVIRQVSWTVNKVFLDCGPGVEGITFLTITGTPIICMYCGSVGNQSGGATIGRLVRFFASFTGGASDGLKIGTAAEVTGTTAGAANPSAGVRLFAALNDTLQGNYDFVTLYFFDGRPTVGEINAMDSDMAAMYAADI